MHISKSEWKAHFVKVQKYEQGKIGLQFFDVILEHYEKKN